jgi:catechol 2,3-dioxygenase-like lactoylglutathione lyase family enzyme
MNATGPKLEQLNIVSDDIEASIAFYRRLGVDIPEQAVWRTASGTHHVSAGGAESAVDLDLDSIAFARKWNAGWQGREDLRGRVVVGFSLPSREAVDATYADLTGAGYVGLQAPWDAFWGARYAIVEDPDGIAVGLMSPQSDDRRSPPPKI